MAKLSEEKKITKKKVITGKSPPSNLEEIPQPEKEKRDLNITGLLIGKIILAVLCIMSISFGIFSTTAIFIPLGGIADSAAMFLAPLSGFLAFIYLLSALVLYKLIPKFEKKMDINKLKQIISKFRMPVLAIGIALMFLNFMPLMTTPSCIIGAEDEFEEAYGSNWRKELPDSANPFFQQTQFNLANYYLGIPHSDCNYDLDLLYYQDEEVKLYCDVYYPKESSLNLPGNRSTIIKIHGGSWRAGDKTIGNAMPVSKYLAAQGYVVFDIQYGLYDSKSTQWIPTPENVLGNFTLLDMVRHIGEFTKKLDEEYAQTYDANKDSVFIMGGSAGGHLTSVCGLGYNDPYYEGYFAQGLNIKGIIPYYPPNNASKYFIHGSYGQLIEGNPDSNPIVYEKMTPSNLADAEDPQALIFQGLQDGLVPPENSWTIEKALEDKGVDCIVLTFPLAAHANDLLVHNNYAQVWLYYLERFLVLSQ